MRHAINALIEDYSSRYGQPTPLKSEIIAVVEYGIRNGYLNLIEKRHAYTFGGVTIALTDSELAEVMSLTNTNKSVAAIKMLRDISPISLKLAKEFVDHLKEILSKMES